MGHAGRGVRHSVDPRVRRSSAARSRECSSTGIGSGRPRWRAWRPSSGTWRPCSRSSTGSSPSSAATTRASPTRCRRHGAGRPPHVRCQGLLRYTSEHVGARAGPARAGPAQSLPGEFSNVARRFGVGQIRPGSGRIRPKLDRSGRILVKFSLSCYGDSLLWLWAASKRAGRPGLFASIDPVPLVASPLAQHRTLDRRPPGVLGRLFVRP